MLLSSGLVREKYVEATPSLAPTCHRPRTLPATRRDLSPFLTVAARRSHEGVPVPRHAAQRHLAPHLQKARGVTAIR